MLSLQAAFLALPLPLQGRLLPNVDMPLPLVKYCIAGGCTCREGSGSCLPSLAAQLLHLPRSSILSSLVFINHLASPANSFASPLLPLLALNHLISSVLLCILELAHCTTPLLPIIYIPQTLSLVLVPAQSLRQDSRYVWFHSHNLRRCHRLLNMPSTKAMSKAHQLHHQLQSLSQASFEQLSVPVSLQHPLLSLMAVC